MLKIITKPITKSISFVVFMFILSTAAVVTVGEAVGLISFDESIIIAFNSNLHPTIDLGQSISDYEISSI